MKFLPERQLKVRPSFLFLVFVVAPCAVTLGVNLLFSFEELRVPFERRAILAAALGYWGVSRILRGLKAVQVVRDCEEAVAELIEVDRSRDRRARHSLAAEKRRYRFLLQGKQHSLFATVPSARPLFIDDAHTLALVLRSPTGGVYFLGADFSPLRLSAEEERAVRDRIEQYRELPEALRAQMR